jgi:hypothetical protein
MPYQTIATGKPKLSTISINFTEFSVPRASSITGVKANTTAINSLFDFAILGYASFTIIYIIWALKAYVSPNTARYIAILLLSGPLKPRVAINKLAVNSDEIMYLNIVINYKAKIEYPPKLGGYSPTTESLNGSSASDKSAL